MNANLGPVTLSEALRSARETRVLEIGSGILSRTASLFREQFGGRPAMVVSDSLTNTVAGHGVLESFRAASHPCPEPFIYSDPKLYAEFGYVTPLEIVLKQNNAIPVAVGSGTINDLTKLAAHRASRP